MKVISKRLKKYFYESRWLFLLILQLSKTVNASYDERRLYEDLMRDYNNLERPVANHSQPVTIYLKVSLQQVYRYVTVLSENSVFSENRRLRA
jgi:hypothetical protein